MSAVIGRMFVFECGAQKLILASSLFPGRGHTFLFVCEGSKCVRSLIPVSGVITGSQPYSEASIDLLNSQSKTPRLAKRFQSWGGAYGLN